MIQTGVSPPNRGSIGRIGSDRTSPPTRLSLTEIRAEGSPTPGTTIEGGSDPDRAAIRLGLSNSDREGLNRKIRPISHRGYGFHTRLAGHRLVYLACVHIDIALPR